jgi:hypothetical protein
MALQLYRRHRKECESGHAEDSKSGQFEEGRRGWKRCACMIHASGTLGGKFKRRFQSWQLGKPQGPGALSQVCPKHRGRSKALPLRANRPTSNRPKVSRGTRGRLLFTRNE